MLGDLNTSVGTISEDALAALFDGTPEATPTADSLVVGTAEQKKETPKEDSLSFTPQNTEIPLVDLEKLDETSEPAPQKKEKAKDKTPEDAKQEVSVVEDKKQEDKKEEVVTTPEVAETLKNTVDFLISKGLWKDFDGRQDVEWTEELYAELAEAQAKAQAEELYTSKKQAAGDYGQAIIDFIEKGGDPDTVIDLFKEQKALEQFDIDSPEAQEELVAKYYKEVLGWKSDRIRKTIISLNSEEDGLKTEAEDIKEKYDQQYREQLQELQRQQAVYQQQEMQKKKAFEQNLSKVIDARDGFDDTHRSRIKNALFKFNQQLPDGTPVNELYVKFAQLQSDPKEYVEFAEFVLDRDNYIRRKATELTNKVAENTFKFVKGGASKSNKGTSPTQQTSSDKPSINFSNIQFR